MVGAPTSEKQCRRAKGVVATNGTVFLGHSGLGNLSDLVVVGPK